MQEADIMEAIILQTARSRTASTPVPIKRDNFVQYVFPPIEVRVTVTMHTNEIELSLLLESPARTFFQDAVQTWLGEPVRAYLFSNDTIDFVVKDVTRTIAMIFRKLETSFDKEINRLNEVDNILSLESLQTETRKQAALAWEAGRYDEVLQLYSSFGPRLSPLEIIRSKLSRYYLGKPK
jgi:hypothetical protein